MTAITLGATARPPTPRTRPTRKNVSWPGWLDRKHATVIWFPGLGISTDGFVACFVLGCLFWFVLICQHSRWIERSEESPNAAKRRGEGGMDLVKDR